jgi:hypothetical protein
MDIGNWKKKEDNFYKIKKKDELIFYMEMHLMLDYFLLFGFNKKIILMYHFSKMITLF